LLLPFLLLVEGAARADPAPVAPLPAATERQWYGWQTLAADGAALVFGTQGQVEAGLATFVFGAPVVHWAHGRVGAGFGSLALRVSLPLLGLVALDSLPCRSECSEPILVGLLLITAPVPIDAAVLAYETVPVETVQARWTLEPAFRFRRGKVDAGVVGRF
jgi:hypothetical protein